MVYPARGRLGVDGPEIENALGSPDVHFHEPVTSSPEGVYNVRGSERQVRHELERLLRSRVESRTSMTFGLSVRL